MIDRSDKNAKEAFAQELSKRGYSDIKIIKEPADIVAYKSSEKFYFEIKKTSARKDYFGAATLTEWRAAYSMPNNYFFVICVEKNYTFDFIEYRPNEFEKFSTVPPFKIFFNIPVNESLKAVSKRKNKTAIILTEKRLSKLDKIFTILKNN